MLTSHGVLAGSLRAAVIWPSISAKHFKSVTVSVIICVALLEAQLDGLAPSGLLSGNGPQALQLTYLGKS